MTTTKLVVLFFVGSLFSVALADTSIMDEIEAEAPPVPARDISLEYDLRTAVSHLHRLVPGYLKRHTQMMSAHADTLAMLQTKSTKLPGKAYSHNFARARAAIKAALSALTSDLRTGHAHDKKMLGNARGAAARRIADTEARNRGRVTKFRHKACPTKRAEEKADMQKRAAKAAVDAIKVKKICDVATTWKSMGIRGTTPKLGSAMYNKWAKTRGDFVKKTAQHNLAIKAHKLARRNHDKSMTSFRVALDLEAKNTYRSCRDSHKDYDRLKRDVASNVATRKEVYIATLIVGCYADSLSSNAAAKACADKRRSSRTSQWNIVPGKLAPCKSRTRLSQILGPKGWEPTYRNCAEHRRIEARRNTPKIAPRAGFSHRLHKASLNKPACAAMRRFRSSISNSKRYRVVTVNSQGKGTYTCNDSNTATKICRAVKSASNLNIKCNGVTWAVGRCGNANGAPGMEINVAVKNNGRICQCQTGGFTLRPCIGHTNSNWGGWGASCGGGVSQTMNINCA